MQNEIILINSLLALERKYGFKKINTIGWIRNNIFKINY